MSDLDPTLTNPAGVTARLVEEGTYDALRTESLQQLRKHPALRRHVEEAARALLPELQRQGIEGRRKLLEELRRRLESEVLIKAMECYWEVLSSQDHTWSAKLEAELESLLCRMAEESLA
ncbi:hypothetical protein ACKKBG_A38730 [Auxenochlorella protothecoides x Auxenochlorella symbiontica]